MSLHLSRNQEATVWVGGLEGQVTEELIWELMLQAGPLVTVHVPRDKITGEHSGYAFVEFGSEEDADYAMKIMNMVRLYGKPLKINKASRDRKDMDVGANVFVGNLDPEVDEALLYNTFSAFGQVLSAKVMLDDDGTSKGFGFINFADFESSDAAIMAMSGQFLCYRPIHVSYAYKKEGGKGERHGQKSERVLAKKMTSSTSKRPNMRFAAGPHANRSAAVSAPPPPQRMQMQSSPSRAPSQQFQQGPPPMHGGLPPPPPMHGGPPQGMPPPPFLGMPRGGPPPPPMGIGSGLPPPPPMGGFRGPPAPRGPPGPGGPPPPSGGPPPPNQGPPRPTGGAPLIPGAIPAGLPPPPGTMQVPPPIPAGLPPFQG